MTLGIALALLFGLSWIPIFYFRAESVRDALPIYTGSERSWVQATPLILTLHITAACLTLNFTDEISATRALIATVIFLTALGFWFWGRSLIGPLRQTRLPDEPPLQFHRHGAFGLVRHPLYSSYVLATSAPLFVVPRWYLFVTFAMCAYAIAIRAIQEERWLRAHLGVKYEEYCREVKRLVPYVW